VQCGASAIWSAVQRSARTLVWFCVLRCVSLVCSVVTLWLWLWHDWLYSTSTAPLLLLWRPGFLYSAQQEWFCGCRLLGRTSVDGSGHHYPSSLDCKSLECCLLTCYICDLHRRFGCAYMYCIVVALMCLYTAMYVQYLRSSVFSYLWVLKY
jgi:hypothetical protein